MRVGHTTLIEGDGRLEVGRGPVRTGVTVVVPGAADPWAEPAFAGCHRLNGNGELTGLEWIREAGLLTTVIGLTNTHSVGVVRAFRPPDGWAKLFCPECGSALFSQSQADPAQMTVRMSAFDSDPGIRPQVRYHVATAAVWEPIPDDGLPRHEGGRT